MVEEQLSMVEVWNRYGRARRRRRATLRMVRKGSCTRYRPRRMRMGGRRGKRLKRLPPHASNYLLCMARNSNPLLSFIICLRLFAAAARRRARSILAPWHAQTAPPPRRGRGSCAQPNHSPLPRARRYRDCRAGRLRTPATTEMRSSYRPPSDTCTAPISISAACF
eukprot:SAG31_NODE_3588_length_4093_cov_4.550075_2_plen_166_part_00